MAWRTLGAVVVIVFALVIVQATVAAPLIEILTAFNDTGDYSDLAGTGTDGESLISSLAGDWFNMGLIAIFGILLWAIAFVVKRELTRARGGL